MAEFSGSGKRQKHQGQTEKLIGEGRTFANLRVRYLREKDKVIFNQLELVENRY